MSYWWWHDATRTIALYKKGAYLPIVRIGAEGSTCLLDSTSAKLAVSDLLAWRGAEHNRREVSNYNDRTHMYRATHDDEDDDDGFSDRDPLLSLIRPIDVRGTDVRPVEDGGSMWCFSASIGLQRHEFTVQIKLSTEEMVAAYIDGGSEVPSRLLFAFMGKLGDMLDVCIPVLNSSDILEDPIVESKVHAPTWSPASLASISASALLATLVPARASSETSAYKRTKRTKMGRLYALAKWAWSWL